ncbi:beta-lactamase domain-containing protein, partial [mine drainage metagenome]
MYNIVSTGDMKYGFTRLLNEADTRYPRIDSLFIESTYGGPNDITTNRKQAELDLMNAISSIVKNGGKVLIPLFAVGRSQELMLVIENYIASNPAYKLGCPIYLDGMILEASAIHTAYPEYLRMGIQQRILSNNSPFESEIFEVAKGERGDILDRGPSVILASGGMLNGGA